jgi:hypothetical protein
MKNFKGIKREKLVYFGENCAQALSQEQLNKKIVNNKIKFFVDKSLEKF